MEHGHVERRRGKRIALETPILIRQTSQSEGQGFIEQHAKNVSLAGVYFETDGSNRYRVDDVLVASLSVPESQTKDFPFTRLAGKGRVVRVDAVSPASASPSSRTGIAIEFGQDLIALTALPTR